MNPTNEKRKVTNATACHPGVRQHDGVLLRVVCHRGAEWKGELFGVA